MRTKKSVFNFITDVVPFLILGILNFIRIKFIVNYYGGEVNGYIQLITQIFAYLALAEAGFGAAVVYQLYKPLANKDQKKISEIVAGAKQIFKKIAITMSIGTIIVMIVLPFFVNRGSLTTPFIVLIFFLYALQYLIEYFVVYPYASLLQADQNQYIVNVNRSLIKISFGIIELAMLYFKVNLIIIAIVNILFTCIYIFKLLKEVRKKYPWLDKKAIPDTSAIKMTKDVLVHKLSGLVFSKTDPIVLSKFSLQYVSIYTAYSYILDFITSILSKIFNSLRASYCNIVALGKVEDRKYFNMFLSFSFFSASFCSVTFHVLINNFIGGVWLDSNYLVSEKTVLLFSLIIFGRIIMNPIYVARDSKGLYKETKLPTIIQAVSNLVLSLLLVVKYGIFGVLFATVLSQYLILIPFNLKVVYSKVFKNDSFLFIRKTLLSIIDVVILYIIDINILKLFNFRSTKTIFLSMIVIIMINFIFSIIYYFFVDKDFKILSKEVFGKFRRKKI